jgi:hypothetical protein
VADGFTESGELQIDAPSGFSCISGLVQLYYDIVYMDEYPDYVENVMMSWDDILSGKVNQLEAYWALEVAVGKALLLPYDLAITSEQSLENVNVTDNHSNAEYGGIKPKLYEQSTMIDFIDDSRSFSGFEEMVPSPINHNRVNQSLLLPDKDDEDADECSDSRIGSPTPFHEKNASEETPKAPSKLIMSMFPLLAKTYENKEAANSLLEFLKFGSA